jgi:hypothetical protein
MGHVPSDPHDSDRKCAANLEKVVSNLTCCDTSGRRSYEGRKGNQPAKYVSMGNRNFSSQCFRHLVNLKSMILLARQFNKF